MNRKCRQCAVSICDIFEAETCVFNTFLNAQACVNVSNFGDGLYLDHKLALVSHAMLPFTIA